MTALSLREENEVLREENRQLRALKLPTVAQYRGVRLTAAERCIVATIASGDGVCTRDYLLDCFDHLRRADSGIQPKTLAVMMVRIRKKLGGIKPPVEIATEYGIGYSMTEENKARLLARKEP